MKTTCLLLSLTGCLLLCGCDKQTRANTEKIETLSQKMVQLQHSQSQQLKAIQSQLTALAPMLAQTNSYYFAKSYDNALFFHTNTLYLLLTISKTIQKQLQAASDDRVLENLLAQHNHTNLEDRLFFCTAQITSALEDQSKQIQDDVNTEINKVGATLTNVLQNQIKWSALDKADAARKIKIEAAVAQIQRDLDAIKSRLGITNPPAAKP